MSELTEREVAIFTAVRQLAGAERKAYLDEACAGDAALRRRLDELLGVDEPAGDFLERPAYRDSSAAAWPGGTFRSPMSLSEKPGESIGHYKLLQQIGEGGCGVVYMAEQEEPVRRKVALKVVKLGMDTKQVIARFEAERQALALMDHPNIAKVFDAGATAAGRPYFVMELVKGISITRYCDDNDLSTVTRLGLFVQVCQAIQHAHQKGIIHRDIKPSNILVEDHDGVPVPKVIDFGIAKATTGQRLTDKTLFTAFDQFIGTPAYMSPEQARLSALDIDTRSDIYSLGVLLYELLTSKTPFDAKLLLEAGLDEVRRIIREEEPVRPSTKLHALEAAEQTTVAKHRQSDPPKLVHLISGDLDWIVMKALDKDRGRRYESANGLVMDIQRHLNDEPVVARPPSTAYRVQKAWKRNKLVFTAAVVMVAALILGITVSTWSQQAEKQARLRADRLLYVANMTVAQQAWDQNNIGRLRQSLEDTKDSAYLGFEWYYWQPQTHLALKTLRGHLDAVLSVSFSPDGHRIVTGSVDNTAKVWEAVSGRELLTLKGHSYWIRSAAFSPDGGLIATGSYDHTAKLWDATTGKELVTLRGHTDHVRSVAFSLDGKRIVTGSEDNTAKVWDVSSGRELLTLKEQSGLILCVAFSPDGQRIVIGNLDGTIKVWDVVGGREPLLLKGHTDHVGSVAFSPTGERIVSGSRDRTARVWDAASGRELVILKGHSAAIQCVNFSANGQQVVTGSEDNTAKIWDAAGGAELFTLKGHGSVIMSVAFAPDGHQIVTGSGDTTAKVWDAAGGLSGDETSRNLLTLEGHADQVNSMTFSPSGDRIAATGSSDKTAKVWDSLSGRELLTLKGHSATVLTVAFSPDGRRIVTGSRDATAKVWDAASGGELRSFKGHDGVIWSVAFSPDGRRVVTGSEDHTAKVWDAASGGELRKLEGHTDDVGFVAFSPDGQRIVTGSDDRTAKVWDAASGRFQLTLKGHTAKIWSVAFSPDGRRIVTGSFDNTAAVWEAAGGKRLLTLQGHNRWILSVAFSPDGQRIVTGIDDNTADVWEAASGRELLTLKGHRAGALFVAFSPDGQRILTGSRDGMARVWDTARVEQVAAWQEEERTAVQSLTALRLKRTEEDERQRVARVRESIQPWLILAPIALSTGQSGAEALDIEQIEGEGGLRPKAGEARSVGGGELKWIDVTLKDYVIDFNAILGQVTTQSVAYAVCYIRSDVEKRGLHMLVGSQDEAKVYLNGKQVYKAAVPHGIVEVQETVSDIALNNGLNVLVFKVVTETLEWKGSVAFTDAQGNSVEGIKMTLDPEAKRHP